MWRNFIFIHTIITKGIYHKPPTIKEHFALENRFTFVMLQTHLMNKNRYKCKCHTTKCRLKRNEKIIKHFSTTPSFFLPHIPTPNPPPQFWLHKHPTYNKIKVKKKHGCGRAFFYHHDQ